MTEIVERQIDYYRARADEYDEWYFRQGRYDQGAERNAVWFREVGEVEAALAALQPSGRILDLACGTGLWTRLLAPHATRLTAVDASAEMLALNRSRLGDVSIDYVQADIFTWQPVDRFDFICFGFWISHIPRSRWDAFWSMLSDALAVGGTVFFVDNGWAAYRNESRRYRDGEDACEERILNDGRRFPIIKNFFVPAELTADLAARGWHSTVRETETFLIYGFADRKK